MVDLSSSTSAAASVSPVVSNTSNLTVVPVTVASVPASLDNVSYTLQINATPQALDENNLTLSAAAGLLTVTLPELAKAAQQNLQQQLITLIDTQKTLTLSVQAGSPPTQAVLLLPTQNISAVTTDKSSATRPLANAPVSAPTPTLPVAAGTVLSAVVLSPEISPPAPVALFPAGSGYNAPVLTVSQPEVTPTNNSKPLITNPSVSSIPAPSVASPQPSAPVTPAPIQPSSSRPAVLPALSNVAEPISASPLASLINTQPVLQTGTQVDLHILAVTSLATSSSNVPQPVNPTATAPTPRPNFPAPDPHDIISASLALRGTVTASAPDGKTVIQTNDAVLFVKTPTNLTVGTILTFTLQPTKATAPLLLPAAEMSHSPLSALPQAMAFLQQVAPSVFQQTISVIPQPNEALAGTLLLLLGAFKKSDARGWMGDQAATILIHKGKGDLLATLSREMGQTGQPTHDAVVGEWRSYPIPLYAQEQFQELTLYVHRDRDQASQNKPLASDSKIRFVIDFRLSKLGAMQLDGFMQPQKIDMLLRSENHLPEGLHDHLRSAYINAISAVGVSGSLNFQVGRQTWVQMQKNTVQGIMT